MVTKQGKGSWDPFSNKYIQPHIKQMQDPFEDLKSFDPGMPDPSEIILEISPPNKGVPHSEEAKKLMSVAAKKRPPFFLGKTHTKEVRTKLSELYKGKPFIGEHNNHQGTRWWNDGQTNKRSVECPGKEFIPGRMPLGSYKKRR